MIIRANNRGITITADDINNMEYCAEYIRQNGFKEIHIALRKEFSLWGQNPNEPMWSLDFLQFIDPFNIRKISIDGDCYNYENLYRFNKLESLSCTVKGDGEVIDLLNFPSLKKLETVKIENFKNLSFPKIENFSSSGKNFYPDLLEQLKDLKTLHFYPLPDGFDFNKIARLKKLEYLSINQGGIINLDGIEKLKNLNYLELYCCRLLENIGGISALTKLQSIRINNCTKLSDASEIAQIKTLQALQLENLQNCDLDFIKHLTSLKCLDLDNCGKKVPIQYINKLPNLKTFAFNNVTF